jgi:hypothetical protein
MPTSILIGFEYKNDILPGTLIDLYHCHKWCKSFGCTINILTDIKEINTELLYNAIANKLANKSLLNFYDITKPIIIFDNLIDELLNILKQKIIDDKLIVYYTGHGVLYDNLVMPNENLLSMKKLKSIILENVPKSTEIFLIFDCCNPDGMGLPFKLKNNSFVLSSTDMKLVDFIEHKVLLITSSANHQKSVATQLGSLFTRYLFKILIDMNNYDESYIKKENIPLSINRNLQRLTSNLSCHIRKLHTGYQQNISIYSSYIIDPVLWLWLGNYNNHNIICDYTLENIIVKK